MQAKQEFNEPVNLIPTGSRTLCSKQKSTIQRCARMRSDRNYPSSAQDCSAVSGFQLPEVKSCDRYVLAPTETNGKDPGRIRDLSAYNRVLKDAEAKEIASITIRLWVQSTESSTFCLLLSNLAINSLQLLAPETGKAATVCHRR